MRRSALLVLALLGVASEARATNGPNLTLYGYKGPVDLPAYGDGFSAIRMPSSIAWTETSRFDFSLFLYHTDSTLKNRLNDFESSGTSPGAAAMLVVAPGRPDWDEPESKAVQDYSAAHKLTLAFGVYPELVGGGGRSRVRFETFSGTMGTTQGLQFISLHLGAAFTPTEWLGLGLSFQVIRGTLNVRSLIGGSGETNLGGSPTINGVAIPGNPTYADFLEIFGSSQASDPTTLFDAQLETFQFSTVLSASIRPHDNVALAFSYRPRAWAPFYLTGEGRVRAETTLQRAVGGLAPSIQGLFFDTLPDDGDLGFTGDYDVQVRKMRVPQQVRFSAAVWPLDRLCIGVEVAWVEWHRAFNVLQAVLKHGDNRDLNFIIGSDQVRTNIINRWRNTWSFAGQVAWGVTEDLTLRLAFSYARSPINSKYQGNSAQAGFVNETIFLGAGYRITPRIEVSFLFEHAFYDGESSRHRPSELTAKDSRYGAKQTGLHFGLGLSF